MKLLDLIQGYGQDSFPLALWWERLMGTSSESFVLIWDSQRVARGIPSIFG